MKIPAYQIDAFTNHIFAGNPAAVCPLDAWLEKDRMQAIAQENNLSETAFFVPEDKGYHIRWFTPVTEVDLCGHATLASAFVVFNYLNQSTRQVEFNSRSGKLIVMKENDRLAMNFPAQPPEACETHPALIEALGKDPLEVLVSEDYFVIFSVEQDILDLRPDMEKLKRVDLRGIVVTAKGNQADFVSRFFAPKFGVHEDPVTGSAHCALIPYWAKQLGKKNLLAHQISQRGGELFCRDEGTRVVIAGQAVLFMKGIITL